jgi:hypothetical protein
MKPTGKKATTVKDLKTKKAKSVKGGFSFTQKVDKSSPG